MLRIAIQSKGRLFDDTMALLQEAGIKLSLSKRTLLVRATNFPMEVLFLRDDDIPQTVADGAADIGVVGLNEVRERGYEGREVEVVQPLGFSQCRLSLAIPKDEDYGGLRWFEGKRIATSYPNILQDYLHKNNIVADVHVINGSVEVTTGIGMANAIFDIVSSGSTLVSNNLKEVETVMKSEAVLIANQDLEPWKRDVMKEFLFRLTAVQDAADKKYVLMNAPRAALESIVAVLPGIKSPTILPLADNDWCSIHTVLDEERFWEIIGQLKAKGAQGIVVLPIENMIL